ncbi:M23 family metallopeptidase [Pseudescherichia sp.]|uniref:M23 family metallopeptidase n=1 Tax=Pseudescherichia sp. TaxID=2055881 RepID=UPI00289F6408|nr:M23 family metallopeptidase [Pseudescherichia sp.]
MQKAVALASLQPAPLFSWPLSGSLRVTSPFGMRFHPLEHTFLNHEGVDLRAPPGSEVGAIADGRVAETGYGPLTGFFITIDHADGWRSRYLHLSKIQVHKGEQLKQGTVIALSGATGRATGPHLHLELSHNHQAIDPVSMLAASPGSPIASATAEKPAVIPDIDMTPTITLISGEGDTLQVGVRIGNKTTFYSLKEPVEQGDDVWRIVHKYDKYKLVKVNAKSGYR